MNKVSIDIFPEYPTDSVAGYFTHEMTGFIMDLATSLGVVLQTIDMKVLESSPLSVDSEMSFVIVKVTLTSEQDLTHLTNRLYDIFVD